MAGLSREGRRPIMEMEAWLPCSLASLLDERLYHSEVSGSHPMYFLQGSRSVGLNPGDEELLDSISIMIRGGRGRSQGRMTRKAPRDNRGAGPQALRGRDERWAWRRRCYGVRGGSRLPSASGNRRAWDMGRVHAPKGMSKIITGKLVTMERGHPMLGGSGLSSRLGMGT